MMFKRQLLLPKGVAPLFLLARLCSSAFLPTYLDASGVTLASSSLRQQPLSVSHPLEEGVGHFSEWSKSTKRAFIDDVRDGKAGEWTIVMGNEGGGECRGRIGEQCLGFFLALTGWALLDLDSMTAALTWSYHLSHLPIANLTKGDEDPPPSHSHYGKAIALLQTPLDALDLRPENKLALHNVQMSPGHRDLLTIDELPLPAEELAKMIKGIILVDHPVPRTMWNGAKILSIFDHHNDRGAGRKAQPRIFEATASCTTIVAREMLNELEALPKEYHMPHEVVELILDAIALDSDGLTKGTPEDSFAARRLLKRSNWREQKLLSVMQRLDDEMSKAKKDLDSLSVRDLLRRDWKGDQVTTKSKTYPQLNLGLASIPYSLDDQISRTLHEKTQSWFDVEQQWTQEIGADVSLSLNSYKLPKKKEQVVASQEVDEATLVRQLKVREICLVVRPSDRLSEEAADNLFEWLKKCISESPFLDTTPWHGASELEPRQMVFVHHQPNGGRKLIRPIVEDAVKSWSSF